MSLPMVVSGDDITITGTLLEDDLPIAIPGDAIIQAGVINGAGGILIGVIEQTSSAPNADWANGVIVCQFPAASTGGIPTGQYTLVVELFIGGARTTFLAQIRIVAASLIAPGKKK
jgi:hypothetical protein